MSHCNNCQHFCHDQAQEYGYCKSPVVNGSLPGGIKLIEVDDPFADYRVHCTFGCLEWQEKIPLQFEMTPEIVWRIRNAKNIVVFTGSGISKESGISTFRDNDGIWSKLDPETFSSKEGFKKNPEEVWKWYMERRNQCNSAKPNYAHRLLEILEDVSKCDSGIGNWKKKEFHIITQNVDGLHQRAGSKNVIELHGSINRFKCIDCNQPAELKGEELQNCEKCGGYIRPDVVWFGEYLDGHLLNEAEQLASYCDVFVAIGTSASVHPASSLLQLAKNRGAFMIEINPEQTDWTPRGDLFLQMTASKGMQQIMGVRDPEITEVRCINRI